MGVADRVENICSVLNQNLNFDREVNSNSNENYIFEKEEVTINVEI